MGITCAAGRMLYPRDTLDWTYTARTIMDDMQELTDTLLLQLLFEVTIYHTVGMNFFI